MLRRILLVMVGVLLVGDIVGLAALPSGERHLADVIPKGDEVLLTRTLSHTRVMVVASGRNLRLIVAYKERKRWHSVKVDPAPAQSNAAWAATNGAGNVPAFSAVYGRADAKVVVRWQDGQSTEAVPVNGVYIALRRGRVRPQGVDLSATPAPSNP